MKPSILVFACGIFLMIFYLAAPALSDAAGVEFVTKEKFLADKNPDKDLPVRILFKKLSESRDAEKRRIRNLIILKQVFEQGMQEQEKAGIIKYKRTYGIIRELNFETIKITAAETGQDVSYHVGIDGIPLENPGNYKITGGNAHSYAVVIYTLDERIYKIEIGFPISEPSGLSLARSGANNILTWKCPESAQKPSGYQIIVNARPLKTVGDTSAEVPRAKDKADVYKVKAVYKHGSGTVVSAASGELQDHITLAEIKKEEQEKEQAERAAGQVKGQAAAGSGIQQAVIDFREKRYTSAFNNFMTVYGSQMEGIQKAGSGYIKGVLGLPPKYRAEIIFLVEYERIREKSNNDTEAIRTGLEDLLQSIEGMQGAWAIITEDKRIVIKRHINEFK